jgi:mono/diheme cytochrome c family protein
MHNTRHLCLAFLSTIPLLAQAVHAADATSDASTIDRGRYLARASGCNDCHTPGYPEAAGQIPVAQWLTGSSVGFQGPWGTSYPANLRLYVQGLSEAEWLQRVHQPMRPPMPWFNLREMSNDDLVALYRFIRALGPAGEPAPPAAGPGVAVNTPYIEFVPKNLPKVAKR